MVLVTLLLHATGRKVLFFFCLIDNDVPIVKVIGCNVAGMAVFLNTVKLVWI
jgi:hypothetical protein